MIPSETYQCKLRKIKAQYKLYDDFIQNTELTFENRSKIIQEMGRLLYIIEKTENMTLQEVRKKCDDWPLVMISIMN